MLTKFDMFFELATFLTMLNELSFDVVNSNKGMLVGFLFTTLATTSSIIVIYSGPIVEII